MRTYTVQVHRPSGETHALSFAGDTITGITDALPHRDVHALTPADLPLLTYRPYAGNPDGTDPDGFAQWSPPIIATEPAHPSATCPDCFGIGELMALVRCPRCQGTGSVIPAEPAIDDTDAQERWNVGYAREWDAAIVTADQVAAALRAQAADAGWDVTDAQLVADAETIAAWLHTEREKRS